MPAAIDTSDIVGRRFGKLKVQKYLQKEIRGKTPTHMYECLCDCGNTVFVSRPCLLKGDTTSCGCAHQDAGNRILEDLTGQRFGQWLVLERAPNRVSPSGKTRRIMWKCKCTCGTEKIVGARALKTGMSTSCGCVQKKRVSDALTMDLTGKVFGHLTVLYRNGSHRSIANGTVRKSGVRAVWHCQCDCGNECDVTGELLRNGDVTSCGCSHTSKYEMYVSQYLEACGYVLGQDYFREKTFSGLTGLGGGALRFDFFVCLHSGEQVLIECQGLQHVRKTEWFGGEAYLRRLQAHDVLKKDFAEKQNIRLVEIHHTKVSYALISEFLRQENVI